MTCHRGGGSGGPGGHVAPPLFGIEKKRREKEEKEGERKFIQSPTEMYTVMYKKISPSNCTKMYKPQSFRGLRPLDPVADLRGGGGGGFRGFKPPLGLPSKNVMCIEKRHHYVQTHTVCSYSTLSQAQPQTIGFKPPPPWAAK